MSSWLAGLYGIHLVVEDYPVYTLVPPPLVEGVELGGGFPQPGGGAGLLRGVIERRVCREEEDVGQPRHYSTHTV